MLSKLPSNLKINKGARDQKSESPLNSYVNFYLSVLANSLM